MVGLGAPRVELDAFQLSTMERALIGCFCYAEADFQAAVQLAGNSAERLATLVSHQVPLEDAPAAFDQLIGAHPAAGKVLVRPDL